MTKRVVEPERPAPRSTDRQVDPDRIDPDRIDPDLVDTESLEPIDLNSDPLGDRPSQFVGTGVGAAGGGAAGAALGTVVGGPVGAIVGGAIGAVVGGLTGNAAAAAIDPEVEAEHWRREFRHRDYVADEPWEVFAPAYAHGWEARREYPEHRWEDVEEHLETRWREARTEDALPWERARPAARDAWDRLSSWFDPAEEEQHWAEAYRSRPYVQGGEPYDLYAPAYRFGWEAKRRDARSRWEQVEDRLEREWSELSASARLGWERARHAVRDGWHRVEERLPGDADRDGR